MAKRGRKPGTKTRYRPDPTTGDPIVRKLFEIINERQLDMKDVGKTIGFWPYTLTRWKHGETNPSMLDVQNLAQYLGYEIILKPKE